MNVPSSYFWGFCTHPFPILEVWHLKNLSHFFSFHFHHGVEVDILEDEGFRGMGSSRLSSRNYNPNSVLPKDFLFFSVVGPPLLPLLFFDEAGAYPHRGGNGFPMHAWSFNLRFNVVRIL